MKKSLRSFFAGKVASKDATTQEALTKKYGTAIDKKPSAEFLEIIKRVANDGELGILTNESLEEEIKEIAKATSLEEEEPKPEMKAKFKIDINTLSWADIVENDIDLNVIIHSNSLEPEEEEDSRILIPKDIPEGLMSLIERKCGELKHKFEESKDVKFNAKDNTVFSTPQKLKEFLEKEKDLSKTTATKLLLKLIRGIDSVGDPKASDQEAKSCLFITHIQLLQLASLTKDKEMKDLVEHCLGKLNDSRTRTADQLMHFFNEDCVNILLKALEIMVRRTMSRLFKKGGAEWGGIAYQNLSKTLDLMKPSKKNSLQSYFKTSTRDVEVEIVNKGRKTVVKEKRTISVVPQIRTHQISMEGPEKDLIASINGAIKPDSISAAILQREGDLDSLHFCKAAETFVRALEEFSDRVSKVYAVERDSIKQKARDYQNKNETDKTKKELLPFYFNQAALEHKRGQDVMKPFKEWFNNEGWEDISEIPNKRTDWIISIINRKIVKVRSEEE